MNRTQKKLLASLVEIPANRRQGLSVTRLSIKAELSEKTVRNNLKLLQHKGFITTTRSHQGIPYDIQVLDAAFQALDLKPVA